MTYKRGKKYKKAIELINKDIAYSVKDAIELLEKTNTVKFDPSVEVHFNLNLNPKYADQIIRTTITLPNWSGKTSKICAFTDWNIDELINAWVTKAWWEELIADIEKNNVSLDFDVCVATPNMMRHLGKIARILGPKGLMPNPKVWTVTTDLVSAIKEISAGKFEFKTDKEGNVHSIFWKLSFWAEKLEENLKYFLKTINDVKPSWAKGKYINSIFICNAMGPSIRLEEKES